jgi:anaerobic ribonucleoside-triphosphate reductase activating protein
MNSGITGTAAGWEPRCAAAGGPADSIRVGGVEPESIVDGPGFRYTLFVQGCHFRCPGCHNRHLQTFDGGRDMSVAAVLGAIQANPLLDGLTLSGGDPFTQAAPCAALAEQVRARGLSVVTFTGYLWEDLLASRREDWRRLLAASDIIVDGPFVMEKRDIGLRFRGSANQRLIDAQRSLAAGRVVTLPEAPP